MRALRTPLLLALGAALLPAAGLALRGGPASLDGELGWPIAAGAFLVFLGWLCALLGWGGALGRALLGRDDLLLRAAAGSGLLALLAILLAQAGLIGWHRRPLLFALLLAGPVLDVLAGRAQNAGRPLESQARAERVTTGLVQASLLLLLGLALLQATLPDGHPDPLYYHLLGPRLWAQAGQFYLPSSMPILLQCSTWDGLGTWGQSLLGGDGGGGLLEGQLFMQWAHALLGGGGAALALAYLSRPFFSRTLFCWTFAASGACAAAMVWTLPFAKNDWGAAFWLLAGAAFLLQPASRRETLLGGALFGLGLCAKPTAVFTAAPLFLLAVLRSGETLPGRLRWALAAGGAAFAAMLPILLRNLGESGNPVFPSLNGVFHSPLLTQSWADHLAGFEGSREAPSASFLLQRARQLWVQTPLVAALAVPPLLWLVRRRAPRALPLWGVAVASLLLFAAGVGRDASLRLFGPGNLLLCGAGALSVLCLFDELPLPAWLARPACIALAAAALATSQARWRLPLQLASAPPLRELLLHASPLTQYPPVGGEAKAFLRLHATSRDKILSLEDDRLYALSALDVVSVRDDPELDVAFARLPFTEALKLSRANLLITTSDWRGRFRGQLTRQLGPLLERHPEAVLFTGDGVSVVALPALLAP